MYRRRIFSRIINLLSNFSDIIQNIWWLITLVVAIFVLMNSLFSIRKKANKYTGEQVKKLIQDGKYIPGVFVELNNSKEVLRYFVYGKKWRKRLIKNFNYVYDNSYGEILKKLVIIKMCAFVLTEWHPQRKFWRQ